MFMKIKILSKSGKFFAESALQNAWLHGPSVCRCLDVESLRLVMSAVAFQPVLEEGGALFKDTSLPGKIATYLEKRIDKSVAAAEMPNKAGPVDGYETAFWAVVWHFF